MQKSSEGVVRSDEMTAARRVVRAVARGLVLWLLAGCGGPGPVTMDSGVDSGVTTCAEDRDCDDTIYCNGAERCAPGALGADDRGCLRGDSPCAAGELCDEASKRCGRTCTTDADLDGHLALGCGGDDCDDGDADRFPGNVEYCDPENRDEDCDPTTFGARDVDVDGHVAAACCNGDRCGDDCDDARSDVYFGLIESCDARDNDCDGSVDEGTVVTLYADADRDLHGNPEAPSMGCAGTPGYSTSNGDCDDTDPSVHVGAPETCDGVDDDCNSIVDDSCSGCPPSTGEAAWVACSTTRCANTSSWVTDCGGCDRPCTNDHGDVSCVDGACAPTCASGYDDCNGITRDGCETSLLDDDLNCGACGTTCAAGERCSRGHCATCSALGMVDCFGTCVPSDAENCGSCGVRCPDGTCSAGHCTSCQITAAGSGGWVVGRSSSVALSCPNMPPGATIDLSSSGTIDVAPRPPSGGDSWTDLAFYSGSDLMSHQTNFSQTSWPFLYSLTGTQTVPADGNISTSLQLIQCQVWPSTPCNMVLGASSVLRVQVR